jgi:hypothetical protein
MSLLERRIAKLERPNMDTFDTRLPANWQEFYTRILNDGPARQSSPVLTAAEAWAISSHALSQSNEETIEASWLDYLDARHHWR